MQSNWLTFFFLFDFISSIFFGGQGVDYVVALWIPWITVRIIFMIHSHLISALFCCQSSFVRWHDLRKKTSRLLVLRHHASGMELCYRGVKFNERLEDCLREGGSPFARDLLIKTLWGSQTELGRAGRWLRASFGVCSGKPPKLVRRLRRLKFTPSTSMLWIDTLWDDRNNLELFDMDNSACNDFLIIRFEILLALRCLLLFRIILLHTSVCLSFLSTLHFL